MPSSSQEPREANVLTLFSQGLLSKWGFNDGDEPDVFLDYCEANGIDYGLIDWHQTLIRLVREHLLPVIEQEVEVYEIQTIHNPIRAQTVNGVSVDVFREPEFDLTPECVDIPFAVVVEKAVRNA